MWVSYKSLETEAQLPASHQLAKKQTNVASQQAQIFGHKVNKPINK